MQKMVMISQERWDKMMETYDALVLELEETKKALKNALKEATASNKGK